MADLHIISINKKNVALPEIQKPITWQYLKKTSLTHYRWATKKALDELERELKARFPDMVDSYFVASPSDWDSALKNFKKFRAAINKDKNVSKSCREIHGSIDSILYQLYFADMELERAPRAIYLTNLQVVACFNTWLIKNRWKNVQWPLEYNTPVQSTALKNGKKIIAIPLRSDHMLYPNLERNMSEAMLNLFKIKIKDGDTQVALAVADDNETRKHFMPYSKFILKTGIRIFMVKAPDKVVEIKK